MATEARRGIERIAANYLRLACLLALGLVLVPVLISWVGLEAFGLIELMGASVGFAGTLQQLTNQGMIRDLSTAYHSGDADRFARAYSSAYVVSGAVAALSAVVFVMLLGVIHLLRIPDEWVPAARWLLAAQGAYACLAVLAAPAFSMYRVQERFGWYAFWMVLSRATALTSALLLAFVFGITETADAIRAYGLLWSGLLIAVLLASVVVVIAGDRRLIPDPRRVHAADARAVFHTFGWNGAAHVGVSLYERLAALLMNLAFGVFGNAVFGVAHRLVAYVRMATTGVTFGLDSASARLSSESQPDSVRDLLQHSIRLQAFVALPASLAVFVLAEPALRLWIGGRVPDPEAVIPLAVTIVQILIFSIASRAIADGWTSVLFGAGHVRRYAPLVLAGGLMSPLVGGALLLLLPESLRFQAPAIGFAVVFILVHGLLLPAIAAGCLDTRYTAMFTPLGRPLLALAVGAPVLFVANAMIDRWTLGHLAIVAAGYGVVFTTLGWFVVLTRAERQRFGGAIRRRLAK